MQNKQQKIASFNPSHVGLADNNIFGLPFTNEESEVVIIPMPWEVTVSYRHGTAKAPAMMLDASYQVDLYDADVKDVWKMGIGIEPISKYWEKKNKELRPLAEKCIANLENGGSATDKKVMPFYKKINDAGLELNVWMKEKSKELLKAGKLVAVAGGEHSAPQGLVEALAEVYPKFSILHIDAHADYREAYEGFTYSHASIQYNVGKLPNVERQVLLSIRDYSEQEANRIASSKGKVVAFADRALKYNAYNGMTWREQCKKIIEPLGQNVYISFDIDALDPSLCPHTGTPVPGGLEFEQVFFLIDQMIANGKKIIGFDLSEVAPGLGHNGEWDAVVGARALYRLATQMAKSQGRV